MILFATFGSIASASDEETTRPIDKTVVEEATPTLEKIKAEADEAAQIAKDLAATLESARLASEKAHQAAEEKSKLVSDRYLGKACGDDAFCKETVTALGKALGFDGAKASAVVADFTGRTLPDFLKRPANVLRATEIATPTLCTRKDGTLNAECAAKTAVFFGATGTTLEDRIPESIEFAAQSIIDARNGLAVAVKALSELKSYRGFI